MAEPRCYGSGFQITTSSLSFSLIARVIPIPIRERQSALPRKIRRISKLLLITIRTIIATTSMRIWAGIVLSQPFVHVLWWVVDPMNSTRAHKITGNRELLKKISSTKAFAQKITVNSIVFDRIFGGNTIDIRPQGSAELQLCRKYFQESKSRIAGKAAYSYHVWLQRKKFRWTWSPISATRWNWLPITILKRHLISKIKWSWVYRIRGRHHQKIETGNVFSSRSTASWFRGSQSLFGNQNTASLRHDCDQHFPFNKKEKSNLYRLFGQRSNNHIWYQGRISTNNRHFFLSQYFKEHHDANLTIWMTGSSISITRIEVWVTQRLSLQTSRNIVFRRSRWNNTGYQPDTHSYPNSNPGTFGFPHRLLTNIIPGASLRYISTATSILNGFAANNFTSGRNYETVENARLLQPSRIPHWTHDSVTSPQQQARQQIQVLAVARIFHWWHASGRWIVKQYIRASSLPWSWNWFHSTNFLPSSTHGFDDEKHLSSLGGTDRAKGFSLRCFVSGWRRLGGNVNYPAIWLRRWNSAPSFVESGWSQYQRSANGWYVWFLSTGITIIRAEWTNHFPGAWTIWILSQQQSYRPLLDQYPYYALYDSTKTTQSNSLKKQIQFAWLYQSSSGSDIPLNAVNVPQGSVKALQAGSSYWERGLYWVILWVVKMSTMESWNQYSDQNFSQIHLFNLQTKTMMIVSFGGCLQQDFFKSVGKILLHLDLNVHCAKSKYRWWTNFQHTIWGG